MPAGGGAGLAGYRSFEPSERLRPFVRRFLHGYTEHSRPHRLSIPPSRGMFLSYVEGTPLTVHFSDRCFIGRPRLFIGGQLRREAPVLESEGRFGLIGTEFTATGFHRLFHRDAEPFTDEITDLRNLAPADAERLASELGGLDRVPEMISGLDRYLCSRVPAALDTPLVDGCVAHVEQARGVVRVEELAARFALGARRLHRYFLRTVGVGPKHFAKIVQLNAVVESLMEGDSMRLDALALDCGYYDQSHFIRDFQRYVGINPLTFLQDEEPFLRTFLGNAQPG